jgi:serine/threonine protein kinase
LIRFAAEIAAGMEFLAKKRVVHADLAARNILVSFELHTKICDFGLARQIIDYNYIKSQQCPLPWKWMAIESLSQMKFSTMSDVWAYGVTLWEIFTLGNVPYPGMVWNMNFVDQLQNGLRMPKPAFAGDAM